MTNNSIRALLGGIDPGVYRIEDISTTDYRRVRELCGDQYADADSGCVDTVVAASAEAPRRSGAASPGLPSLPTAASVPHE